jgi:adenylate kinase
MDTQTFVFFGIIGSGKGTQVKLLMDYLKSKDTRETLYAGTGEEFRKLINSNSFTANRVKETMVKGELQPDFLTSALFSNILINSLHEEMHLFADGYPRTVRQSESLDSMMKFFGRNKVKIIYIELSDEEAIKRNLLRGRTDDTQEGIEKRIEEYKNNVIPAMSYFKNKDGYEIVTINGEQKIEKVQEDIIKAINL